MGGAERLVASFFKYFPEADIYTSLYDQRQFPWLDDCHVYTTFIQKLPGKSFWRKHYVPLSPLGFEQFRFDNYDVVISISAGCAKGVITPVGVRHIGILLTPPRYQWDMIARKRGNPVIRRIVDGYLRVWDTEAGLRPDTIIAISKYVQNRISKIYRRKSTVIYPGIDHSLWQYVPQVERESFFLVVSRLYDYKRIDLAIEACQALGRRLVIIGEGPEYRRLSAGTKNTISFLGRLDDNAVRSHMQRCTMLLFPGIEDFGLVPVEAMACGTPVVAYGRGGVAETVVDGKTGVLFHDQTVADIVDGIKRSEGILWDRDAIAKHAKMYDERVFIDNITSCITRECS